MVTTTLRPGLVAAPFIGVMVGSTQPGSWRIRRGCPEESCSRSVVLRSRRYMAWRSPTATGGISRPERFYESVFVLWLGFNRQRAALILWSLAFINLQLNLAPHRTG